MVDKKLKTTVSNNRLCIALSFFALLAVVAAVFFDSWLLLLLQLQLPSSNNQPSNTQNHRKFLAVRNSCKAQTRQQLKAPDCNGHFYSPVSPLLTACLLTYPPCQLPFSIPLFFFFPPQFMSQRSVQVGLSLSLFSKSGLLIEM